MSGGTLLDEFLVVAGLASVQAVGAVFMVFLSRVLVLGVSPLFLVTFANLATALFLLPVVVVLEKYMHIMIIFFLLFIFLLSFFCIFWLGCWNKYRIRFRSKLMVHCARVKIKLRRWDCLLDENRNR